jgi:predicted ATP-grasp superfamily ATP-dependent carboligase
LLLEYVTGGGLLAETPSGSLLAEGALMLGALLDDWLEMPDITVVLLQDQRLESAVRPTARARVEIHPIASAGDFQRTWQARLADCDAVWPIAPESGGVLERLCREAEEAGTLLLNCPPEAVAVAASKADTATRLAANGVPAVPTRLLAETAAPERFPLVAKPDDGLGCLESRIIRSRSEWEYWVRRAPRRAEPCDSMPTEGHETASPPFVLQPLVGGESLSLSAIFAHGEALLLSGNRQHVREIDGRFVFRGCLVNALQDVRGELQALTSAVAAALPELWGYAGIDFIGTDRGPLVLEVNPRLTTSYAGLRKALGINVGRIVRELRGTGRLPVFTPPRGQCVDIVLEQGIDH